MDPQNLPVVHVPPAYLRAERFCIRNGTIRGSNVAPILFPRHVRLEPVVVIEILDTMSVLDLVLLHINAHIEPQIRDALAIPQVMIHRVYLNPIRAPQHNPRLPPSIPRADGPHHPCLHKRTRPDGGHRVLVVVRHMKMPREPHLDLRVLPHGVVEHVAISRAMVQPRAPVLNMHLLQHPQLAARDGGVREDEDLPAGVRGVGADDVEEPRDLRVVDVDLVGGEGGVAEARGGEAEQQCFFPRFGGRTAAWACRSRPATRAGCPRRCRTRRDLRGRGSR
mmetsp:Transcript_22365/g.55371  ORF Transcript_22365/g.55371 Transcript_22365/m.55371 type:complete len:279 (-) Transcript_22365:146-982(-)